MSVLARIGDIRLVTIALARWLGASPLRGYTAFHNPSSSSKDIPVARMFRHKLLSGELDGRIALDSTSGNSGIAYATLATEFGTNMCLVISSGATRERVQHLRALGAELVFSDPAGGSEEARRVAKALHDANPGRYCFMDQYSNPEHVAAHYERTAVEILAQAGPRLTHIVAGIGTGATITGVGRRVKEDRPGVQIIGVEPSSVDNPIEGLKAVSLLRPDQVPPIFDPSVLDGPTWPITREEAYAKAMCLSREQGLFVGPSSGAAVIVGESIVRRDPHAHVVVILPDSGSRYLSEFDQRTEKEVAHVGY